MNRSAITKRSASPASPARAAPRPPARACSVAACTSRYSPAAPLLPTSGWPGGAARRPKLVRILHRPAWLALGTGEPSSPQTPPCGVRTIDVSRHGIGVFRFALLFATGLALFVLYFVVLWPLSYQLSEGPYFTYEYLRSSSAIWAQLYRLFGWLPWLSPWSRPTQDITGGLWLILYSALFALYLAGFLLLRWSARAGSSLEQDRKSVV